MSAVPVPVVATTAVGLCCAAGAAAAVGRLGAGSALLATGVVVGFLWSGAVPLRLVQRAGAGLGLLLLLLNYVLRLLVALVVVRVAARAGLVLPPVVGLTVIACALTWTTAQVAVLIRSEGTE